MTEKEVLAIIASPVGRAIALEATRRLLLAEDVAIMSTDTDTPDAPRPKRRKAHRAPGK